MTPQKKRPKGAKSGPYSYGKLRNYAGNHIAAETLVKHLTGRPTASGAGTTSPSTTAAKNGGCGCGCSGADAGALPPAGRMVFLIGLPASGKSTISDAFEKAGWLRFNKDALRKELYGDESKLGNAKEVNALFYSRLEEALRQGRNVLIDNTNVNTLHRKGSLAMAEQYGYDRITHVFLDVPLEECLRRNALRERKVPEEAMRQLAESLTWPGSVPSAKEGDLIVLKPGDAIGDFLVDRVRQTGRRRVPKVEPKADPKSEPKAEPKA